MLRLYVNHRHEEDRFTHIELIVVPMILGISTHALPCSRARVTPRRRT
jgi:hypothetical protein